MCYRSPSPFSGHPCLRPPPWDSSQTSERVRTGTLANIKQQKKRILVAQRQRLENLQYRSTIKTYFRRLEASVQGGDAEAVAGEHVSLVRLLDKAAAHRALHPNTAARKKSLAARMVAAGPVVEEPKRKARSKSAAQKASARRTAANRSKASAGR